MAKKAYIGVDGKARKIKKGYVGVENFVPRALPSGYTQVAYIEADGKQRFDTGFVPNGQTRMVLEFEATDVSATNNIIGSRSSTTEQAYTFSVLNGRWRIGYNNASPETTVDADTKRHIADLNKNVLSIDGVVIHTADAAEFDGAYTIYIGAIHAATNYWGKARYCACQLYDETGALVRDYVPCVDTSGVAGLYDMVNGTFGGSITSTAFVAGSAVRSAARKIKRAYIGIGGVARPCWSGGELAYYGKITSLSMSRQFLVATSNENYALFGGGYNAGEQTRVDAYDSALVATKPSDLQVRRRYLAATHVGQYALFGGGRYSSTNSSMVDVYDNALVHSTAAAFNQGIYDLAATNVGNYALFGGGYAGSVVGRVHAYNADLQMSTPTALSQNRRDLAATTVAGHALFAGGYGTKMSDVVDVYDASLTRTVGTPLSVARECMAATAVGDYALFGGGQDADEYSLSVVDAYNKSLTRISATEMSSARAFLAATAVGNYALFGGGWNSGDSSAVDAYDASLTRTVFNLSVAKSDLAATTIGNYALFGGGYVEDPADGKTYNATVDAFAVA